MNASSRRPVIGDTAMDYDEACTAEVTRAEAEREIKRHHADFNDFLREVGDRPEYKGEEVLGWLGY